MKRILLVILAVAASTWMVAQPTKRRTTPTGTVSQTKQTGTDRASLMFPSSDAMPEDVSWRRDIYRQLDLTLEKNAPLYYPVQPIGKQCNLFTYLFRLMLTGRVNGYDYKITGNESFDAKDKVVLSDFLQRYRIYHVENNGKLTVEDADVPSAQVKRYYIKESSYLDQRTGTTHTKVVAICPILMQGDEFGEESVTPQPLFWMKYEDIEPYLSCLPVMASDLNNVTNMTASDFFTLNRYEGKIYKTNNMQGRVIADYCKTDSAVAKEQKRIEAQLEGFENQLWGHRPVTTDSVQTDSTASVIGGKTSADKTTTNQSRSARRAARATKASRAEKKSATSSSSDSAPRVSARRQRR